MTSHKDIESKLVQKEQPQEIPEGPIDPLWSILPSYYMYSNTINKGINDIPVPPTYALSSRPSLNSTNTTNSTVSGSSGATPLPTNSTRSSLSHASLETTGIPTDPQTHEEFENQGSYIKENLLDNIHKLKNFTKGGNKHADAIDISIVFTEDIVIGNRPSKIIDPSLFEYRQGDYIHGYVTIQNNGTVPIPFDMFYFVLEGEFRTHINPNSMTSSIKSRTFLQMFDFNASYNEADINRLIHYDPEDCKKIMYNDNSYDYDQVDETFMCLGHTHEIQPQIKYKRLFTFKIPHKLLDSACPERALSTHVSLPPSFGGTPTKDFATIHSSVNYGVHARFIGRHSKYNPSIAAKRDEFVVLKGASESFRVVPISTPTSDFKQMKTEFDFFYKSVKDRIEEGSKLVDKDITPVVTPVTRNEKSIYTRTPLIEEESPYEFYFPVYKLSAFFKVSPTNTVKVKTPKVNYKIAYIPPQKYRVEPANSSTWNIEIPFELSINSGGSNKPVDIKSLYTELVVLTLESEGNLIPFEMHHDLIFNKFKQNDIKVTNDAQDNVLNNLIIPARDLNRKIYELVAKNSNNSDWKIEKSLVIGVKALAEMNTKVMNLPITNTQVKEGGQFKNIKDVPWVRQSDGKRMTKSFGIHLDLTSVEIKGSRLDFKRGPAYDKLTLVPNFQSCNLCRMYYIRVIVGLSNGQNIQVKLPVTVEKPFISK